MITRRALMLGTVTLASFGLGEGLARAAAKPTVTVHRSPT